LALAQGLLAVANKLIPVSPGRPDYASLRRAVSTAYYALFHRIIEESAVLIVRGTGDATLKQVVSRAFEHGAMKKVAQGVAASDPRAKIRQVIATVPPDLALVADAFVKLQDVRHSADYDLTWRVTKSEVERHVHTASRAFRTLDGELSEELKRFLVMLPMWPQLERR
jgi:uncharacterized protein (UPF0332 family)